MKSRNTLKNERIFSQTQNMLAENSAARKDAENKAIAKSSQELMEGAFNSVGFAAHNSRMKANEVARQLSYPEKFTALALSECLGYVCDHALLLDEDAYAAMEPDYKAKMRDTILSFLENGDVNVNPENSVTKELLVAIGKNMPDPKQFLKEEDEKELINSKIISDPVINRDLLAMSGDVRRRVANRVSTDQAALAAQQSDLDYAAQKENDAAPLAPAAPDPAMAAVPAEDAPLADPDAAPAADAAQAPVANENPAPVAESMKLNVVHEKKVSGIIDTLALNEAMDMIKDGKQYDPKHALANAVRYVTCLEALDDSELVHIGTPGYNRILSKYGTAMNPGSRSDIPFSGVTDSPIGTAPVSGTAEGDIDLNAMPAADEKEKAARDQLNSIINSAFPAGMFDQNAGGLFKPYADWQKEHAHKPDLPDETQLREEASGIQEKEDLTGKYTDIHGKVYTEDELYEYFETQGFYGLTESDFEDLWHGWNFHKH